jgi:chemotaxis protein CheX
VTGFGPGRGDSGERRRRSRRVPVSSWVESVGPWNGAVVLTTGRPTALQLATCVLAEHAPPVLDAEDIEDAIGELANVVGGNVKTVLPGPSVLGLPQVGAAPPSRHPADLCRVELSWRGRSLVVTVQGSAEAPAEQYTQQKNEVPL